MEDRYPLIEVYKQSIITDYRILHEMNEGDALLKYLDNVEEQGFRHVMELEKEFFETFDRAYSKRKDKRFVRIERVYENYAVALRKRVRELEKTASKAE